MKRIQLIALSLLCTTAFAACGDDDDGSGPAATSLLRVVHDSPDAPNVDVRFNGMVVLSDVPYLAASDFLEVPSGPATLEVLVAGSDVVAIRADVDLATDVAYSVFAVNLVAEIDAVVLVDNLAPPASGDARLRLVHGAPSAGSVDVYISGPDDPLGEPLLENVPYLAVADDLTVPAGTYRVRITAAGTTDVAIDTGDLPLQSGVAYTAVAADAKGGGAPFGAILLVDEAAVE